MNKEHLCLCGEDNPDKFYPKRKSMCKTCVSKKVAKRFKHLPPDCKEKNYIQTKEWIENNSLQHRLTSAYNRAKRKNIEFSIDLDYLKLLKKQQHNKCYYSGVIMGKCNSGHYSVSVDRIDSNQGYIPGNVVLCSAITNSMKNNLSVLEFKNIITSLYDHMI